jgi:FkbM family methyltransferase
MIIFKPNTVLEIIQKYLPTNPIIVEAGAFDGRETQKMSALWPNGIIHAFEPVPAIFEKLTINTSHLKNVYRYPIALSDQTGTAQLYISEKKDKPGIPTQANSLLKPKERLSISPLIFPTKIEVPTTTLDDWAHDYHINHVDFLWLDLQGYELNVLKASPKTLKYVKVIYTEVEFIEAYEDQYQYPQVKTWLEDNGFIMIGKDFSDKPTWFFGNALFIRQK